MLTLLQIGFKHKQCLTSSAALSWVQDFETVNLLKYGSRLFSDGLPVSIKEKEREKEKWRRERYSLKKCRKLPVNKVFMKLFITVP